MTTHEVGSGAQLRHATVTPPVRSDGKAKRRRANAIRGGSEAAEIRADSRSVYPHPATRTKPPNNGNTPSAKNIRKILASEKTNTTKGHPK
ncbi:MAG: hypothetical protein MJ014_02550 [Methanocorpusculum sp.]|nr:hypothetical protein [Methanocorpusculum sp.]